MKHGNDARDIMSVQSWSPSMACDMEEVCSESSTKMQDKEETTSEASWNAVTKGKEKEVWSLELEGEAERPEPTVPWNGVNFSNLFHPSFSVLLIPFSRPDSFCPILRGQSREISLHLKTKGLHEKGQRGRTLFARCCCHLSPQFQSFR